MIGLYLSAAGSFLVILLFWSDRAAKVADRQRMAILDFAYSQADFGLLCLEFDQVSFKRHYRAVLLGRDPAALYSPRLAAAMTAPGASS